MPTIADALGVDYRGAQANTSTVGRFAHGQEAVFEASRIPSPAIKQAKPDISALMPNRVGDNVDIFG
ncbi:hypothetical protein HY522_03940 [bacterium]|nr:hypothetical protein [bacterium]